jgi:hypothetical protein
MPPEPNESEEARQTEEARQAEEAQQAGGASVAGERIKAGINWISDFSAFGFSLAVGITTAVGQAFLGLDWFDRATDEEEVFVYLPVALVIAWVWYLLWLYSADPEPKGRAKSLGRVFAFINVLLLWLVASGFDLSIN